MNTSRTDRMVNIHFSSSKVVTRYAKLIGSLPRQLKHTLTKLWSVSTLLPPPESMGREHYIHYKPVLIQSHSMYILHITGTETHPPFNTCQDTSRYTRVHLPHIIISPLRRLVIASSLYTTLSDASPSRRGIRNLLECPGRGRLPIDITLPKVFTSIHITIKVALAAL